MKTRTARTTRDWLAGPAMFATGALMCTSVGLADDEKGTVVPTVVNHVEKNANAVYRNGVIPTSALKARPLLIEEMGQINNGGVAGGVGVICNLDSSGCQLPDQAGHGSGGIIGVFSDFANGLAASERFVVDAGGNITSICWWGFYNDISGACSNSIDEVFTINIYGNTPGCPASSPDLGNLISSNQLFETFGEYQRAATGNIIPGAAGDFVEYEYTANLIFPAPVGAGDCFWVEISNDTSGGADCGWVFSTSPGDGVSYQNGADPPENDFDLAMCIDLAIGSTAGCSLDINAECPGDGGDCGEANGTPGCDDECCCTLVCQTMPECCTTEWDALCRDAAVNDIGCATIPLCDEEANCQIFGRTLALGASTTPTEFRVADDFTLAGTGVLSVDSICWQGVYGEADAADAFTVRILSDVDADGYPDAVVATYVQGGNMTVAKVDTNIAFAATNVFQYSASLTPAAALNAGQCYYIEISNIIAGTNAWFWQVAEKGAVPGDLNNQTLRQGNARYVADGNGDGLYEGVSGEDFQGAGDDMSFCLGTVLQDCACGHGPVWETGYHKLVLFNAAATNLGWSSGDLIADNDDIFFTTDEARRKAEPFTIAADTEVTSIAWEGFEPAGVTNETMNLKILARPDITTAPDDSVSVAEFLDVPFNGIDNIDTVLDEVTFVFDPGDLFLPAGDYWLVMYAGNTTGPPGAQGLPSNFAWFTNAPHGTNQVCQGQQPPYEGGTGCDGLDGDGMMWRARTLTPGGGANYGAYTLPTTTLDIIPDNPDFDPCPDAADLYNGGFRIRGYTAGWASPVLPCPVGTCLGDTNGDGIVNVVDLVAVILDWGTNGAANNGDVDGSGLVDVSDLTTVILAWGDCP